MASKGTNNALENFIKFGGRETPEKMREVAVREFDETEELREKCLKEMRALIKENGLACITRDDFLLSFLRTKKFKIEESFERLQNYVKQRVAIHKDLLALRPEILEKCLRLNILGYLPYRDAEESLIFFLASGGWTPSICSDEEMTTIITVMANYASEHEYAQLTGGVLIFDNAIIHLANIPYLVRHMYFCNIFLFNSLPMRFRAFHCINENSLLKYVLRLIDPFIPKKLKSRIILHGKNRDKFFQYLPRCILPDEYGGTLGPLNNDHLIDIMLNYLQKMKDEQRYFVEQNL